MRVFAISAVAVLACMAQPAAAQYYQGDPCSPQAAAALPFIGAVIAQRQAEACQRQRQAIFEVQQQAERDREAQQQAQQQIEARREAAADAERQARIDAANRRAAAEVERQEVIQAELTERREAAAARAETDAESSPDNFCRTPSVAADLLKEFSSLVGTKAVDIAHLVTVRHDSDAKVVACHGSWLLVDGEQREGTLTFRPNVAGDMISEWHPGHWSPPVAPVAGTPEPAEVAPAAAPVPAAAPDDSFHRGLVERTNWEEWFNGLSPEFQEGATFWAAQRSLSRPASCKTLSGPAANGCAAARARLALPDYLRKSDPEYRRGWNSYQAPASASDATPGPIHASTASR